ncbi:MAG: SDR family oxidoreductase [Bacteroidetes bacterium]|nr:SDR family oxidoreductase [Bacteroidota bacterium]
MTKINNSLMLITGGASGIGLLMGQMALSQGASGLIIWDSHPTKLKAAAELLSQDGQAVYPMQTDVSLPESVQASLVKCMDAGLVPDIIVLNAGVVTGKFFVDHHIDDINRTLGVNVLGCMLVAKAFLPAMTQRGSGHIVTIASAAGMLANPRMSVYAASKWAVLGWSESLRLEMKALKTGIRVTTVTPSYIDTGMFHGARVNFLLPLMKPEKAARKIISGVVHNRNFVRMPALVYLLPLFKGILPVSWFDFLVGKLLGVYKSMDHFTGHA